MNKHFLLGLSAGCAVGTMLGLLFAPGRGKATREKISEAAATACHGVPLVGTRYRIKHRDTSGPIKQAI
jgi:gas vesicle protein